MTTEFYLIVNSNGTTKTNKRRPMLADNEIAIGLSLALPDSLFKKPTLTAKLVVTEEMAAPSVITPELQNNIRNAIAGVAGMNVVLTIDGLPPQDHTQDA